MQFHQGRVIFFFLTNLTFATEWIEETKIQRKEDWNRKKFVEFLSTRGPNDSTTLTLQNRFQPRVTSLSKTGFPPPWTVRGASSETGFGWHGLTWISCEKIDTTRGAIARFTMRSIAEIRLGLVRTWFRANVHALSNLQNSPYNNGRLSRISVFPWFPIFYVRCSPGLSQRLRVPKSYGHYTVSSSLPNH